MFSSGKQRVHSSVVIGGTLYISLYMKTKADARILIKTVYMQPKLTKCYNYES